MGWFVISVCQKNIIIIFTVFNLDPKKNSVEIVFVCLFMF